MVKQLEELCLTYIYRHFKAYPRLGGRLRSKHKAMLLERMCWHGMYICSVCVHVHVSMVIVQYIYNTVEPSFMGPLNLSIYN